MSHSKIKLFIAILILGVVLVPSLTHAQEGTIGSVNLQTVLANHPEVGALEQTAADLQAQLEQLSPEEQQQMLPQFQQLLMDQEMQMMQSITEAAEEVANELNLAAILDSTAFIYGGVDITEQVIERLNADF